MRGREEGSKTPEGRGRHEEGGMQMRSYRDRVIVGSPGAGQYRVFSSVREHSQHSATMAENGRQLPNAAPATLSSSLSLSLSLSLSRYTLQQTGGSTNWLASHSSNRRIAEVQINENSYCFSLEDR